MSYLLCTNNFLHQAEEIDSGATHKILKLTYRSPNLKEKK